MFFDNYYLHAINSSDPFDGESTLLKLEQILSSGYLLSRRRLGDLDKNKGGWQGFDYISLCDYSQKDAVPYENDKFYIGYTSYNSYIKNSLSFVLNKKGLKVVKPELMPPAVFDWDSLQEMRYLGNHPTKRFTDFPDELQVKNRISLKDLAGITLPLAHMTDIAKERTYTRDMIIAFLKDVNDLLQKYCAITPVYDLDTSIELKEIHDVDNALQKIKI